MKIRNLLMLVSVSMLFGGPVAHADIDHMGAKTANDLSNHDNSPANDPLWIYSDDGKPVQQQLHNGNQVYYYLDVPKKNWNYKIYKEAVKAWNKLKVIKYVQVTDPSQANVKFTGKHYKHYDAYAKKHGIKEPDYAGITYYDYVDASDNPKVAYMTNTVVFLQPFNGADDEDDYDWTNYRIEVLPEAEHELGHVLGLTHDYRKINGKYNIMNGNGAFYYGSNPLGENEKQLLQTHYFPTKN